MLYIYIFYPVLARMCGGVGGASAQRICPKVGGKQVASYHGCSSLASA